jgi:hypothetical protein
MGIPGTEAIVLLEGGKPLKDAFLMSRLRIGEKAIVVQVRETSEVVLLNGRANRNG